MKIILFRLFNAEDEHGRQTGRLVKMYVKNGEPNMVTYSKLMEQALRFDTEREAYDLRDKIGDNKIQLEQVNN